jgi:hypothetical protein
VTIRRTIAGVILALSAVIVGACGTGGTDSGFNGTWVRTARGKDRSIVAIWQDDGRYRFAVNRYNVEGAHHLRCTPEGDCAYFDGHAPYYALEFAVRADTDDEAIYVDCRGDPFDGKRGTPIRWVERITLEPGGLELRVQRVELNGEALESIPRLFTKQSDAPRFR